MYLSKEEPLYYRIRNDIMEKISNGEYLPGQKLPSETELMSLYGVSRMTVRLAMDMLENEQYIRKVQGKGTFVRDKKIFQEQNVLISWTDRLKAQGQHVDTEWIRKCELSADKALAEEMHLEKGEMVYLLERLKRIDGVPAGIGYSWIRKSMALGIDKIDMVSIYDTFINKYNLHMQWCQETVEACVADEKLSKFLKIEKGQPIIKMSRLTYDDMDRVMEKSMILSRADMTAYRTVLRSR